MAISILAQKKKNKFLLPIFGGIILITLIVLWFGFFKKSPTAPPTALPLMKFSGSEININWEVLKNPILNELEAFDVILPLEGDYGRNNPFLPY